MKKHLAYLRYVIRHKYFVFKAGMALGPAPGRSYIGWVLQLLVHDFSKLTPTEWFPYVENFYGEMKDDFIARMLGELRLDGSPYSVQQVEGMWLGEVRMRDRKFDRAWLNHIHANPHHWQYWVLREDSGGTKNLLIPDQYLYEMVADWFGAGRAITGKWRADEWYKENSEKMTLHPVSRTRVEQLLAKGAAKLRPEAGY